MIVYIRLNYSHIEFFRDPWIYKISIFQNFQFDDLELLPPDWGAASL